MAEKSDTALAKASFVQYPNNVTMGVNPYLNVADLLGSGKQFNYEKVVKDCRFYFRHDPLANTVIGKIVDIAINDLHVHSVGSRVSQQEKAIYDAVKSDLLKFLREAAFEYLTTGLVVPEIRFTPIKKAELRDKYIPRITSLRYPTSMWIRDSKDIVIKRPMMSEKESLFLKLPSELINFINNKGDYGDGIADKDLYKQIAQLYPEIVAAIRAGKDQVLLKNPLVIKSTSLADSPYPIPYLYPALEALKHKRNLRRMDYSIAARVISAIMHVKVGSDEFPLTADQQDVLDDLELKFKWRQNLTIDDIERVVGLFTNHTVSIDWIYPDTEALLDDNKYNTVNQDIIVALGFPRILITGETERSFASDPQIATISPLHTMEQLQRTLLPLAKKVFSGLSEYNTEVSNIPEVEFKPISLMSLQIFYDGLKNLYDTGNLSRQDYAEAYGYELDDQLAKRKEADDLMKELKLEAFAPTPHSNAPGSPGRPTKPPEGSSAPKGGN